METTTAGRFKCAACGTTYRWKTEWAGRSVKCRCGHVMVCPVNDPAMLDLEPPEDDLYALADAPATAARASSVAVSPANLQNTSRTLEYRTPTDRIDRGDPEEDKTRDLWMPIWLIAGSIFIQLCGVAVRLRGQPSSAVLTGMGALFAGMVISTAVMLGGLLLAARMRGLNLGKFWTAVLKLAAISIAPSAVQTLLTPVFMMMFVIGSLISWGIGFLVYFALIGALFDLDQSDTWFCVMVIFLLKVAIVIAVMVGGFTLLMR